MSVIWDFSALIAAGTTQIGGLKGRKFKTTVKFNDPALNAEIAGTFDSP
jgi:hypothetical protein